MKKIAILSIILVALLTSCEKVILTQTGAEDLVVVEAYLYKGEAVDDVYLSTLLIYGGEDTLSHAISDATVSITHNGITYPLIPSDSAGYYHYPGSDLDIVSGESYGLEIQYFDKTTSAQTTVPFPPTGLGISTTTYYIDSSRIQYDYDYYFSLPQVEIHWDASGNDYFYILVENIEPYPIDIFTGDKKDKGFKKITLPIQGNIYSFMPVDIIHQYGMHLIRVYRVNKEYADLYESMNQDSRDLNEPLTNIINGLGVFTAFCSDSLYMEVLPQ